MKKEIEDFKNISASKSYVEYEKDFNKRMLFKKIMMIIKSVIGYSLLTIITMYEVETKIEAIAILLMFILASFLLLSSLNDIKYQTYKETKFSEEEFLIEQQKILKEFFNF